MRVHPVRVLTEASSGRRGLPFVARSSIPGLTRREDPRMSDEWIEPTKGEPLTGVETFTGLEASVSDFWAFAMSDLRANNVRGYLAEFLVAQAVGAAGRRIEWDAYDVLTPDGIKIEVKASGRLQTWRQRVPSRVVFSGLKGRALGTENDYAPEATYNADVYVFAVQTATTHEQYDPLDVSQWEFHVVGASAIWEHGRASLALGTVHTLSGGPVEFSHLATAIAGAAQLPRHS